MTVHSPAPSLPARGQRRRLPLRVTLHTHRREPAFARAAVALNVFVLVREQPSTLAAVLMPDRLHWLLAADGGGATSAVWRFMVHSTRRAWTAGHRGRLWRPGWERVTVGRHEVVARTARQLLVRPVVAGLAPTWQAYPWAFLHPAVGG